MVALADRRIETRTKIDWPISLYHPDLGMFINGRSMDVSRSGAKLRLSAPMLVRPGQVIELNFPRTVTLARKAGNFGRIKLARVVRVEREEANVQELPSRQVVAVRFDSKALQ